jgi:hypothetical protein
MKIEICDYTKHTIMFAFFCVTMCVLTVCVYKYNCLAYEKGYVQKQLDHSTQTYWTKE